VPEIEEVSLSRPIPGQSLTHELRDRPWQNPPQFNTVEESMGWYLERFENDEIVEELMSIIEMGIPISTIANSMQLGAVLQGIHTIDVGVLVMPILIEIMKTLAEKTGIEYKMGDEPEETERPSDASIQSAINDIRKKGVEPVKEDTLEEEDDEEPMGLMARRA
tara:strand:+ start:2273 stop:2764 length:492 start_codon:yes stop_codon:yes gene_type:complete